MEPRPPPEEEVCWLQPTDSLALSVSPVDPTSSSSKCDAFGDDTRSCQRSKIEDDNQPLAGEFIWGDASDDEIRRPQDNERDDDPSFVRAADYFAPGVWNSNSPARGVAHVQEAGGSDRPQAGRRVSGDSSCSTDQLEDIIVLQDEDNNGRGRSPGSDGLDEEERDGNVVGGRHRAPRAAAPRGLEYPEQEQDDDLLREEEWVDHGEFEEMADFAPAWDQGKPTADNHRLRQHPEERSPDDSVDDLAASPPRRRNQLHQVQSGLDVDNNVDFCDTASEMSPCEQQAPQPCLTVCRRTRASLIRERRRLDRVPRSQRLSQVRGHPLGGMTLLELEERHLLDVGIGQMTRLLARRHDKRQRRADTDLLRRSARLFQRAKNDREARLSFVDSARDNGRQYDTRSRVSRDPGVAGVARGIDASHGNGEDRRPASASRGRTPPKCSSFSLESEDSVYWTRAAKGNRAECRDNRPRSSGGDPPMGLYSGGGERCSLRHKRPMSAKPALTCGSGWEPGRTRARRGHGCGQRRIEGRRNGRNNRFDEDLDSNMSDLSPHGIIEYADEEEGPLNEDELERVAASYLLRPGSSFRRSPPIEENDRFADDGSVYLYREGDGIGNTDAEEYGMEDEAERYRARIQDHDDHGWREERMLRDRDHSRGEIDRFSLADNRPAIPPGVRGSISGSIRTPSGKVVSGGGAPSAQDVRTAGTRSTSFSDGGDVARHRERWRQLGGSESDRQLARDHVPSRSDGHSRGADVSELGRVIESKAGDATDAPHGREGRIMEQPPETVVPVCIEQMDSGLHSRKHGRSCAASGGGEAKYGSSNTKLRRMAVRLRQMILDRQASTDRSIRQVFGHFDRRGCGYVNAEEMRDSLTDLRFDVTPSEAQDFLRMIALDGGDRASYAEFVVFVSDPHHATLQTRVCRQAAERLEALGRRSFHLDVAFRPKTTAMAHTTVPFDGGGPGPGPGRGTSSSDGEYPGANRRGHISAQHQGIVQGTRGPRHRQGMVSAEEFLVGLEALELRLSTADAQRLIVRFDVHGDGYISAGRFVSMVESSDCWKRARVQLARQDEADEEADAWLRAQRNVHRREGVSVPGKQQLSEEIVEMARYLGIRVSSDESLLWIASDALEAPVPDGWVVQKAHGGRFFYYNELTGQSRWDHPLDPHFRRLYLRERFGAEHEETMGIGARTATETIELAHGATGSNEREGGVTRRSGGKNTNYSGRLPTSLPPHRMRPNVLDFSSDKALENLRVRRLQNRSAAVAAGSSAEKVTMMETAGDATGSHFDHVSWTNGRESWTGTDTRSSTRPRRRRPASASALREGLEERTTSHVHVDPGRGSESMAVLGKTYGEQPWFDSPGTTKCDPVLRPRRPRSAKATLQRSPTHNRQPIGDDREAFTDDCLFLRNTMTKRPASHAGHVDTQWDPRTQPGVDMNRAVADVELHNRTMGGFDGENSRGGEEGIRPQEPESVSGDTETVGMSPAAAEERAWLLDRLTYLCQRLGDAEAASGGRQLHARSSFEKQQRPTSSSNLSSRRGETGARKSEHWHHESRGASTGALLRQQVLALENRIYDLEGRLQGPNKPHPQSTHHGSHHHHHHHHQPRFPSCGGGGGAGGATANTSRDGNRFDERDRDHCRPSSRRQGDSPEHDVGRFGTGARKERGKSSDFVHESWSYGGARVVESTVGDADSNSGSTCSGSGSPIVVEKGAQSIQFRDGGASGVKAGAAAGRGVGISKAARGARARGGRRRESGNPPGIVLI